MMSASAAIQPLRERANPSRTLVDYYRCPDELARCSLSGEPLPHLGFFRFGSKVICYGSITTGKVRSTASEELHDALKDVVLQQGTVCLPFDPEQAVEDLRLERYCSKSQHPALRAGPLARELYYLARPLLGVSVRRHLQRLSLRGWRSIPFPRWPVDRSVEEVHEILLRLCMLAEGAKEIPFVWFWPEGLSSCIAITHDVETTKGRDFCSALMDLDESFGIRSSFQLIPEDRYSLSMPFLQSITSRGFELNIHDLNHDGRLFSSEATFLERASRINQYARAFGARGFRSAVLYRNLAWYKALEFSYEMSVPNTAHLDPQGGGCCTVMPYFVGDILEIPLTTTQDYSLLHILSDYSINLWKQQLEVVGRSHGIATFNIHPDYVMEPKARSVYVQLLQHLGRLRSEGRVWLALPGEVDKWWRNRAQMRIVRQGSDWKIQGPDSQRAQLAYARMRGHKLEYSWIAADGPQTASIAA
jgi:hypothetical protein